MGVIAGDGRAGVVVGALHVTVRLVVELAVTAGAAGLPGGSLTLFTVTVTATLPVPPLPSLAVTVMLRVAPSS